MNGYFKALGYGYVMCSAGNMSHEDCAAETQDTISKLYKTGGNDCQDTRWLRKKGCLIYATNMSIV